MGGFMLLHGLMKLIAGPEFWQTLGGMPIFMPEIPWLRTVAGSTAMLIEIIGGLAVVFGYRVKVAATAIAFVMLCAFSKELVNIHDFRTLMLNTWPLEIGSVFVCIALIYSELGKSSDFGKKV